MINISQYQTERDQQAVIDLVLYCQNNESKVNIPLSDQPDLLTVTSSYIETGGNFWVAHAQEDLAGCIALLKKTPEIAVLKKFFVYEDYRGEPHQLGKKLFEEFITYAQTIGLKQIVLDTPAKSTRSHSFYKKNGFQQIPKNDVPIAYDYPDRDSLFFLLSV